MPKVKSTSTYPEIDEIREDLNSLKGNVVELTKHIQKDGIKQAEEVGTNVKKSAAALQLRGLQEMKKVEKQVKQKPAQSLAIAFGTGVLLSMLMNRR